MIFERLDEILAQRIAGPILGHQDTPHIAMAVEGHAEQVENFALHPVGRLPDLLDGCDRWIVARQLHFEHAAVAMAIRVEMVDDLDAILVVDAGLVAEAVHCGFRFIAEKTRDFDNRAGLDNRERVGFLIADFENFVWKALLDALVYVKRLHLTLEAPGAAPSRANAQS